MAFEELVALLADIRAAVEDEGFVFDEAVIASALLARFTLVPVVRREPINQHPVDARCGRVLSRKG